MGRLNNYNISGYNLTIWFFRLMLLLVITTVVLLFALNINETVTIREGEILSSNPQSDYKAPFEAQLVSAPVKEGQRIHAGDTLLVIQNQENLILYARKKAEIAYLKKRIESIHTLSDVMQKKKAAIAAAGSINDDRHHLDLTRITKEIKTLDDQYTFLKERLSSANERYTGDSTLFRRDMLSKAEFNNSKDANLMLKESIIVMESRRIKELAEKESVINDFNKERNNILLSQVKLIEEEQALFQARNECQNQLFQAEEAFRQLETELHKQYLIATNDGMVNYIFNTRQTSNLIAKGDLLVSVAPGNLYYYAKAIIPQKDMRYIKAGLYARLRLDAYARFEQGNIMGKVMYAAERKENEKYYTIIQLLHSDKYQLKSGYSFEGEIVVSRMPLFRFIIKKLFKRLDN